MKKTLFPPLLLVLILTACNNPTGTTSGSGLISTSSAATQNKGPNTGIISCLIDGKQKSFTPQGFIEIILDPGSKGPKDAIEILDGGSKEGFQFEFKKSGTTKIGGPGRERYCVINYHNGSGATYVGKGVLVHVNTYDQHHLTGTFSGKMVDAYYIGPSDKNPEFIQITDGKFDFHRN